MFSASNTISTMLSNTWAATCSTAVNLLNWGSAHPDRFLASSALAATGALVAGCGISSYISRKGQAAQCEAIMADFASTIETRYAKHLEGLDEEAKLRAHELASKLASEAVGRARRDEANFATGIIGELGSSDVAFRMDQGLPMSALEEAMFRSQKASRDYCLRGRSGNTMWNNGGCALSIWHPSCSNMGPGCAASAATPQGADTAPAA
jgi:hypothetical protein